MKFGSRELAMKFKDAFADSDAFPDFFSFFSLFVFGARREIVFPVCTWSSGLARTPWA